MYKYFITVLFFSYLLMACSPNNVTEDKSLKKYFDENNVTGTFAVFDNGQGNFTIYNLNRYKDSAYLPASTFKIVNSLIGLQTGDIINEKMIIKWDGIKRANENWNKDLTMEEAFKVSAVPYYQEVAKRIGKDTMQIWLDSIGYGTKKINTTIDSFWLDNSLKITADEQLGLIKKLYFNQLPFSKTTQEIVKRVMIQDQNTNYTLAYKTGLGITENGQQLAWVVGWIEENRHPHLFVLNLEANQQVDIITARKKILMDILQHLGYLEGKK
jgi:beta-lactamase class D